jgi:hypothetical protein
MGARLILPPVEFIAAPRIGVACLIGCPHRDSVRGQEDRGREHAVGHRVIALPAESPARFDYSNPEPEWRLFHGLPRLQRHAIRF